MTHRTLSLVLLVAMSGLIGCSWGRGPSIEQLTEHVTNAEDPDQRRQAVLGLARSRVGKDETTLALFAEVLTKDSSPLVRAAAVSALGLSKDPAALPPLLKGLGDKDMVVRWDTARALDSVIGPAAVQPLMDATKDPAIEVRTSAVRALRHYREPVVVQALLARMDDSELAVRREAHASLVSIFGSDRGPNSTDWAGAERDPIPEIKKDPWWKWF